MEFTEYRELYDFNWIEKGCIGSYPNGTNTDDTFGTYASDYLIGFIGIVAAAFVTRIANASKLYKITSICYFIFTAIGYTIAAVLHQILHEDTAHGLPENKIWWKLSYVGVLMGSAGLCVLGNHQLPCEMLKLKIILDGIVLVLHGAIIVLTFIEPKLLLTGAVTGIVVLYLLAVWAVRCEWVKALSMFACALGFVVQIGLSPMCGDVAYQDCFAQCPLPAPYFNHNALFHVLYALGLFGLGVAIFRNPDQATAKDGSTDDVARVTE